MGRELWTSGLGVSNDADNTFEMGGIQFYSSGRGVEYDPNIFCTTNAVGGAMESFQDVKVERRSCHSRRRTTPAPAQAAALPTSWWRRTVAQDRLVTSIAPDSKGAVSTFAKDRTH